MAKKVISTLASIFLGVTFGLIAPKAAVAAGTPVITPGEVPTSTSNVIFTISGFELDDQTGTADTCEAPPTNRVVTFTGVGTATDVTVTITYGTTDTAVITGKIPSSATEVLDVDIAFSFTHTCGSSPISESGTIADSFDYLPAPTITKVFPEGGLAGDTITITGTGFTAGTKVKFGTSGLLTPTIASLTSMTVTAPAGSGLVAVEVIKQGTVKVSKASAFTYTSVEPAVVKTGASPGSITIKNINLGFADCTGSVTNPEVTVDGVAATGELPENFSATRGLVDIKATPPVLAIDTETQDRDIAVSFDLTCDGNPESQDITLVDALDYFNEPSITSFTPTSGGAGTIVTITGDDLLGTTSVKFGSTAATNFDVESDTKITAVVPAGVGAVAISLITNGLPKSSATNFTYTQLAITKISPATGPIAGGQLVTIEGTGLKGVTSVLFGATPVAAASITVVTEGSKITVLSPAVGTLPSSPVDVSVVTALDAFTAAGAYRYVAAPTITKYDATGPVQGGSIIKVEGTNFFGGTGELEVKFGTALATTFVLAADGKSMEVVLPAKATADTNNKVKLTVKNTAGGPVTASGDFEYLVPDITSLSPASGPLAGGNVVTITGVSFTGATEVGFGTAVIAKANFISATDTSIRVLAPAATVGGSVAVTVKISASLSALEANGYTYSTGPSNLVVSPKIGLLAGGTTVTITGTNLAGITKVRFGTKDGTNLVPATAGTSLTVKTPSGLALGLVDIALVGPAGTTILPAAFEYVDKICVASSELGKIRFEKGSNKLTAKAKVNLTALATAIKTSGCEVVTITTYKFKGTTTLQKQMTKLTNSRILKAKNYLNNLLTKVSLLVTYERVTLTTQKTTFTSLDEFKVNRVLKFGTK